MSTPTPTPPAPAIAGVLLAGIALFALFLCNAGQVAVGVGMLVGVATGAVRLVRDTRARAAVYMASFAIDRMQRGRHDEAIALLDESARALVAAGLGDIVVGIRATHALHRGRLDDAISLAEPLRRAKPAASVHARQGRDLALGSAVIALAAKSETSAMADMVAALSEGGARSKSADASVALGQAIVLARAYDRERLAAHLRAHPALRRSANGRTRRLVHALSRFAARPMGAYRASASRAGEAVEEGESWVATLVPEAARFAREPALGDTIPELPLRSRALPKVPAPKIDPRVPLLLLGVAVIVLTAKPLMEWVRAGAPLDSESATPLLVAWGFVAAVAVSMLLSKLVGSRKAARTSERISRARDLAESDPGGAETELAGVLREGNPFDAATAALDLAGLAARRGAFAASTKYARDGLARLYESAFSAAKADLGLVPALRASLVLSLEAEGRVDDADLERLILRERHGAFANRGAVAFLAALHRATFAGDLARAAEIARSRPASLELGRLYELVCDVLRVHADDPLPEGERERIADELRDDPRLVAFVEAVVPGCLARASFDDPRARIASGSSDDEHEGDEATSESAFPVRSNA